MERLKAAGNPEEQVKAEAEALREVLTETASHVLATKDDIRRVELLMAETKADLIKWMAGLLLAQATLVATLVKLL